MPSRIRYAPCLTLPYASASKKQTTIDTSEQDAIKAVNVDLHTQIIQAFQKQPNLARILHGDRKIRQGGRGRRTSLFPSSKCGGSIALESRLELAYAVVLERSPTVQEYRTQAVRICLPSGRFAYPDFLIRTTSGRIEAHEVKPSIEHLPRADAERFAVMRRVLGQAGVGFQLIDMQSLPSPQALDELLQRYARGHMQAFSQAQIDLARSLLARNGSCTFKEAYQLMARHDLPEQVIDFLSFHQQWSFDQPAAKPLGSRGAQ